MVNTAFANDRIYNPCHVNWYANAWFAIFASEFLHVCTFLHHIYTEQICVNPIFRATRGKRVSPQFEQEMRDRENNIRDSGDRSSEFSWKRSGDALGIGTLLSRSNLSGQKSQQKIYHHFDLTPLASKTTIFSYFGRFTISTQEARVVFGNASGNSCACLILSNLSHASITRYLHAVRLPLFLSL